jgi:hypothetical protein
MGVTFPFLVLVSVIALALSVSLVAIQLRGEPWIKPSEGGPFRLSRNEFKLLKL